VNARQARPLPIKRCGNGRVGNATADGRAKVAQSQTSPPKARTRTVSRGGFGARATSSSS
jgi:uncharacterized protein YgiB involved in biofilm formation